MEFTISAYTDKGIRKESNQDSLCIRRAALPEQGEAVMAVVCDGMGGLQRGELASAAAVRTFERWFDSNLRHLSTLCKDNFTQVRRQWRDLLEDLHNRLLAYSKENHVQLGTTLTAFLACNSRYLTVNIGDSRIYEFRNGNLKQLTQDQSLVAQEIARGRITEEQALHHPQRNILLQCLGAGPMIDPVFTQGTVASEGLYLLCTDGFVHEVSHSEMAQTLGSLPLHSTGKDGMTRVISDITETCMTRGETDNITAVLLKSLETPVAPAATGLRGLLGRLRSSKEKDGAMTQESVLIETAEIIYTMEEI